MLSSYIRVVYLYKPRNQHWYIAITNHRAYFRFHPFCLYPFLCSRFQQSRIPHLLCYLCPWLSGFSSAIVFSCLFRMIMIFLYFSCNSCLVLRECHCIPLNQLQSSFWFQSLSYLRTPEVSSYGVKFAGELNEAYFISMKGLVPPLIVL